MRVDGNCENCKFYKAVANVTGECKYNAPKLSKDIGVGIWPIVSNKESFPKILEKSSSLGQS